MIEDLQTKLKDANVLLEERAKQRESLEKDLENADLKTQQAIHQKKEAIARLETITSSV